MWRLRQQDKRQEGRMEIPERDSDRRRVLEILRWTERETDRQTEREKKRNRDWGDVLERL